MMPATITPPSTVITMARPPPRGVGDECELRSLGMSTSLSSAYNRTLLASSQLIKAAAATKIAPFRSMRSVPRRSAHAAGQAKFPDGGPQSLGQRHLPNLEMSGV